MDLYCMEGSGPCHAVAMVAKAVGVELNKKIVNLEADEQLKPEYLKINPQHTIPTLDDNGFVLWESRAIMIYLVEKYGKNDSLYPKCPKRRALINQRLYFDMGTMYQRFSDYYYPQIFDKKPANPNNFVRMEEAFGFLNTFLDGQEYAAGDSLTLADISLAVTVATYDTVASFDISKYPNVVRWYKHVATLIPDYDVNIQGLSEFRKLYFN